MGQCDFGVSRAGSGTATVVVTLPDGRKRANFFNEGKAISTDIGQADGTASSSPKKRATYTSSMWAKNAFQKPWMRGA
jgi:hypothetical protein